MGPIQVMVTSWRDASELSLLKRQFFEAANEEGNDDDSNNDYESSSQRQRRSACELVRVWEVAGGNVPHAIVATSDLTNAALFDAGGTGGAPDRLGVYMSAWTRFVDGMTDTQQIYRSKRSMWEIARDLDMPASFIELRHRCVHEQKPTLREMQRATNEGLAWLFQWFWTYVESPDSHKHHEELDEASKYEIARRIDGILLGQRDDDAVAKRPASKESKARKVHPAIQSIDEICGKNNQRLEILAERLVFHVLPLRLTHLSKENGMTLDLNSIKLGDIDNILLGIANKMPQFVNIFDEALITTIIVPTPKRMDNVRDSAVLMALYIRRSKPWRRICRRGLLSDEVLKESCLSSPQSQWAERTISWLKSNPIEASENKEGT